VYAVYGVYVCMVYGEKWKNAHSQHQQNKIWNQPPP